MIYQPKPRLGLKLNKKHPLAKGLVGCWVMNEQSGNLVQDLSGHGNHGVNNGATWVPEGLDFDGTDDYINMGDICDMGLDDMTVSAWFKTTDTEGAIIGKSSYRALVGRWSVLIESNSLKAFMELSSGNQDVPLGSTYLDGQWHNIVVVFDRDDNLSVYIDGVYKNGTNISSGSADNLQTTDILLIGRYGNTTGTAPHDTFAIFNGSISEARIYNRALSLLEIKQLNINPYQIFQRQIDPALTYYETPSGITVLDYERSMRGMSRGMNRGIA